MLYASVSRGFKGGGFTGQNSTQATIERTFNPEFAWNYEAGIRSRFLDNRAQVNATLYQMDYSDLQVTTIIGTSRVTDNAADRSEEHTSELQSLMRISYAVFFLKK